MSFENFFGEPVFNFDVHKKEFIGNMNQLKAMTVQEQTLYKKWGEVQNYRKFINRSEVVKAKIWTPTDIFNKEQTIAELKALSPAIHYVDPENDSGMTDWLMLRIFCHTMSFDQTPGRFIRFVVIDQNSKKYLGATSVSSDVISIACRDQWIGWNDENKLKQGKLRNSAIGSCIMSMQPFGYNFLGGKFVASMLLTAPIGIKWSELYGDRLVGMTTTSLYGSDSMYNSIPFWKKIGSSAGKIALKPDEKFYDVWHQWVKEHYKDEYDAKMEQKEGVGGPVTGAKQRALSLIFRAVGLKASAYMHGFERGVYYAPLYENTREFFRGEIEKEKLIPSKKLLRDKDAVMDWWLPKAIARYERLHEEKRLKPEILYYNRMIGLSWEEAKELYFGEVGR